MTDVRAAVGTAAAAPAGDGPLMLRRARLLALMDQALQHPLTVLSAPAGAGKTVLVRQWVAEPHAPAVAWVTLRPHDDAVRVATQLTAAAVQLGADARRGGRTRQPESTDALGERFLAQLVQRLEPLGGVLVFDGLDSPRSPTLVAELTALVEHAPPPLRIVVTQRSRWLALHPRARAAVIGAADLAFTPDEAQLLVREVSGTDLTGEQLAALMSKSEGWPICLLVAALGLRRSADADAAIAELNGADGHVAAFLRDEMLSRQPPAVRRFLARSSVLNELTPSLCHVVTGEPAAPAMLRLLEQQGAFVRRARRDGESYEQHPMLRDLMRYELSVSEPGVEQDLLARAAAWHIGRSEPELAAPYLVEAEQWDELIELLDRFGRTLFERGRAEEMLRWLDSVPGNTSQRREGVILRRAFLLTVVGQARRAEQILRDLPSGTLTKGQSIVSDAIRATWVTIDASPRSVIAVADAALDALAAVADRDLPNLLGMTSRADLQVLAAGSRARASWYLDEVDAARDAFRTLVPRVAYGPWRAHIFSTLALLEALAGNFALAEREARHAFAIAAGTVSLDHPATLDARLAMAHIYRQRDELVRADRQLREARAIGERTHRAVPLAIHTIERALWHLAVGRPERGLAEIDAAAANGEAPPPPLIEHRLGAAHARLLLALGDVAAAERVIAAIGEPLPTEVIGVAVQTALTRRDLTAARAYLDGCTITATDTSTRLEHALWSAIVDLEGGARHHALQRAAIVVAEAQAHGHLRLLLDGGPPVNRLLRALGHSSTTPAIDDARRRAGADGAGGGRVAGLSERELEVVRYLPTPLSTAEISAQLYISLNTLKTHLRTIYRKLGVSGRREAIRRAEELGIA